MTKTIRLCFSQSGILNPSQLKALDPKQGVDELIFFGDGSAEALTYIQNYSDNPILQQNNIRKIGIGITPRYDLRVLAQDGSASLPNYVWDDETRNKWFCTKVAAPHVEIHLSDISSQSKTEVKLDRELTEKICYRSHMLWKLMLIVEARLSFPAMVIDRMTRWTYNLTPHTIDIELLRKETNVPSLDYSPMTDLLSMELAGETFTVKLSTLNEVYGQLVLPIFNSIQGRRHRMSVAVLQRDGQFSDSMDMSYGELGRYIESMSIYTKEEIIDRDHPMNPLDLIKFVERVEINDHTTIWVEQGDSLASTIETHRHRILFRSVGNDTEDPDDSQRFKDDPPEQSYVNGR